MKIPTTAPNGTPFYHVNGMEMNQWQANGVVLEAQPAANGGGYILPHQMMNNPPGYPQAAGYYGPAGSPPGPPQGPPQPQDFAEYMWMENEEEFDKQIMQQLEEEALMEQCIEAMLADEQEARNGSELSLEEQVSKSTLNPLAAEFVPSFGPGTSSVVVAAASTSEVDVQPSVSLPAKSVDSSISELSISQTSEGLTDSSKSSTVEIAEELCISPSEPSPVKEIEKPESTPEAAASESPEVPKVADEASEAVKEPVNEPAAEKTDAPPKETTPTPKTDEVKDVEPKAASPKLHEKKSKGKPMEPKVVDVKTKPDIETVPVVAEPEKVQPVTVSAAPVPAPAPSAPPVFNYAAAARANLPPKQPAAAAPPSASTPPAKTESVPKETTPSQPQPSAAPKTQTKPGGVKSTKNTSKEPTKSGAAFSKAAAGPRKSKK